MKKKTSLTPLAMYLIAVVLALAGFVTGVWFDNRPITGACVLPTLQK